ncbi:serine/threonine-protein kinase [Streptomyces polygonati]|uniref:non-specific serine/threonine protein kinase n=1 Tax=Streptomyces polygonati TaxID=1617087 RepID=A0ABV8HXC2_9ACTN
MDDNGGSGRSGYGGGPEVGAPNGGLPDGAGQWRVPGYTHERELGAGASGLVVLARHDATGTPVAVKYLAAQFGEDAHFREAFRDEALLLGDLDSPYIARFFEYVEDGPDAAIVMELVDGIALHTLLRQEGATDPEPALAVLKGSLLGLAAAHASGVVHRDYKPGNVLVATDGGSKLVDFGIAVRSGERAGVAGTPAYMAPEQWSGAPATAATDVYAATATFYECLTGSRPYAGSTLFELAVQHAEAPIPNERVPEPVRPLIRRGLAKTPPERPQSAAEFVVELEAVASAAYGEDWEERGQRKLAALVALLPLLLPSGGAGGAAGTTALAHTELGSGGSAGGAVGGVVGAAAGAAAGAGLAHGPAHKARLAGRGKLLVGAVVGVLIASGLAVTAVASGGKGPAADALTATPSALTSLVSGTPVVVTTAPSTGGSPSSSASASASVSASASASASTGGPATTGAPAATPAGGTTGGTIGGTGGGTGGTGAGGTTGGPAGGTTGGSRGSTGGGGSTGGTAGGGTGGGTAGGTTGGGGPTAAPTTTAPPSKSPVAPPTTAPPPPPPKLHVISVAIPSYGCSPIDGYTTLATVTVRSDGAAAGTLYLTWYHGGRTPQTATTVQTGTVDLAKGQTSFSGTYAHDFGPEDRTEDWGLAASTDPVADSGTVFKVVPYCGPVIT